MWPRILKNASQPAAEMYGKGSFVAVHSDAGGADDGFVFYELDWDETFATNPTGAGKVHDLWGASPEVELELWRYLLDIDLITTWRAEPRPVDEPVRRAMHDARAYEAVQRFDDQWIRILDVDAALTARTYNATGESVQVGVHDPMFPTNTGTWTISAAGAERSDTPSDVEVDIGTLSAASLGGVSWHDLAAIGAVTTSNELLTRLDTLFAVLPAPFCGTGY
jgi:predicted acetyltransferase